MNETGAARSVTLNLGRIIEAGFLRPDLLKAFRAKLIEQESSFFNTRELSHLKFIRHLVAQGRLSG